MEDTVRCFLDSLVNCVVGAFCKCCAISSLHGIFGLLTFVIGSVYALDLNGDIVPVAVSAAVIAVYLTVHGVFGDRLERSVYLLENRCDGNVALGHSKAQRIVLVIVPADSLIGIGNYLYILEVVALIGEYLDVNVLALISLGHLVVLGGAAYLVGLDLAVVSLGDVDLLL